MIRLPDNPALASTAVNMPEVSAQALAAPARAIGQLGEAVGQVSDHFFHEAEKTKKLTEVGELSDRRLGLAQDYSNLQIDLQKDPDPVSRIKRTDDFFANYQGKIVKDGDTPEMAMESRTHFQEFSTKARINQAQDSLGLANRRALSSANNELSMAVQNQDPVLADRVITSLAGTGAILPEEIDKLRKSTQESMVMEGMKREADKDPIHFLEMNPPDKLPEGMSSDAYNHVRNHAQEKEREFTHEAISTAQDLIVAAKITSRDQLKDKLPSGTRPAVFEKLGGFLDEWNAEGARARRADPENIKAKVGQFYAELQDWKPDEEGQDPASVQLRSYIEDLPDGNLMKAKMRESMTAHKDRLEGEVKTKADQLRESLKQASERGDFGPLKAPVAKDVETRQAIADGWLQDVPKLKAQGFTEKAAETIRSDAEKDPALGQKTFADLWKDRTKRPQDSVNAAPFDIAVSKALLNENGELNWKASVPQQEMNRHQSAVKAYGDALIQAEQWIKLNPDAGEAEISKKLRDLGSKSARVAPQTGPVKAPPSAPGETSMVLPASLSPLAPVFTTEADKYGLDPRFLAAIAMHETDRGRSSAFRNKNNAMGVSNSHGPIEFSNVEDSVARMARLLASPNGPYKNASTVSEIGKIYAPIGAENDPRGLNSSWEAGVSKYLRQLGGDPDQIFTAS